jgi:deoxyribodipyrimidine photo-lyase
LQHAVKTYDGRVVCFFTFDKVFLSRPDFSPDRFQFFLKTIKELKHELSLIGGDLLVLDQGPAESFRAIIERCKTENIPLPQEVFWNRDYEPFARNRDQNITEVLLESGIKSATFRDHLVIEPTEILNGQGLPYQVYTPFAKLWLDKIRTPEIASRITSQRISLQKYTQSQSEGASKRFMNLSWKSLFPHKMFKDHLDDFLNQNETKVTVPIPSAGFKTALTRLDQFSGVLKKYGDHRDLPSLDGTSQMSFFLKNGSITTAQIIAHLNLETTPFKSESGATKFLKELVWREFYYHILWHSPRVENEAYQTKYKELNWRNDESHFNSWKNGQTGYPIVDAGMRQLLTTGWMHNRVRMIVASFLTKDLLIDWRWGERWFMQKLLDGDLAPNNGGWQWAASTGCDAQPYFRIFNPTSQSERFDPEGTYIRTYVRELADVDNKVIHNPPPDVRKKSGYPGPIVDHGKQRLLALMTWKK